MTRKELYDLRFNSLYTQAQEYLNWCRDLLNRGECEEWEKSMNEFDKIMNNLQIEMREYCEYILNGGGYDDRN